MNQDDLHARLVKLGIPLGEWDKTCDEPKKIPIVERQKDLLRQMERLIQAQIDKDRDTVAALYEKVNRLKHGGGV